jgi:hypothetical protein
VSRASSGTLRAPSSARRLRYGPLAGHEVDDPQRHADGVVGETLVVAAEQGDVDGRLDAVRPVVGEHLPEQSAVQSVHRVVVGLELARGLDVARGDDGACLGHQHLRHVPGLEERRPDLLRHRVLGETHPGDLGDVLGEVTHPLEVARDPRGRDDRAQVGRHRLLAGQQGEAALVDALPLCVDLLVTGDDQVREGHIGVEQRRRRRAHLRADAVRHGDQAGPDVVEFFAIALAHGLSLSVLRGASDPAPSHVLPESRTTLRAIPCPSVNGRPRPGEH